MTAAIHNSTGQQRDECHAARGRARCQISIHCSPRSPGCQLTRCDGDCCLYFDLGGTCSARTDSPAVMSIMSHCIAAFANDGSPTAVFRSLRQHANDLGANTPAHAQSDALTRPLFFVIRGGPELLRGTSLEGCLRPAKCKAQQDCAMDPSTST